MSLSPCPERLPVLRDHTVQWALDKSFTTFENDVLLKWQSLFSTANVSYTNFNYI